MECDNVVSGLRSIHSAKNKVHIYQHLVNVRRCIEKKGNVQKFREKGGLELLAAFLAHQNNSILDVVLSTLSNCCLERESASIVLQLQVVRPLIVILNTRKQESILCRTCRLIGNIAQFDKNASAFLKSGAEGCIAALLTPVEKDKEKGRCLSPQTQLMAIRALRLLWKCPEIRDRMLKIGAVRSVSMVLVNNINNWVEKKQNEDLLRGILKCLLEFTKTPSSDVLKQILADGNGFKSLVALIPLNSYGAVKCITNLSRVATSISEMESSNAIRVIIERLEEHLKSNKNEPCPKDDLGALCLLCRNPVNCDAIRNLRGLKLILQILKDCDSRYQENQLLSALSGFQFNEIGLEALVSEGLVGILIACMKKILKGSESLTARHQFKKRPCDSTKSSVASKRIRESSPASDQSSPRRVSFDTNSVFLSMGCMTPPDSDSSPFSSPSCTPPHSYEGYETDDSDSYSPVCSDSESDEILDKIADSCISPMVDFNDPEEDCDTEKTHFDTSSTEERSIFFILVILSRLTYLKAPPADLGLPEVLETLLRYARVSRYPQGRVSALLENIAGRNEFLVPLMASSDFICAVEGLTVPQHSAACATCRRMNRAAGLVLGAVRAAAESGGGKGDLAHILLKGEAGLRREIVAALPYVVSNKSILQKLMAGCKGLEVLLASLAEPSLRSRTFIGLSLLAAKISVDCPPTAPTMKRRPSRKYPLPAYHLDSSASVVTFRLDDGTLVNADRAFLGGSSDFFRALLLGQFKESGADVVELRSVSKEALDCLFDVMQSRVALGPLRDLDLDVGTLLEAIGLADRYLMVDLADWLVQCAERYFLAAPTAGRIYEWSIESGTNLLRVEAVAFALVADIDRQKRIEVLDYIAAGGYLEQFVGDVRSILTRYLGIGKG